MDTTQKMPAFLFVFVLCSLFFVLCFFFFLVLQGSFSVEPLLCGRVYRETPPHLPIHLPAHLPTPRSPWYSRTTSGLEGNPSATTSSGVAGSATSSGLEVGSAASSAPGSDDPVDGSEPVWCCNPQAGLKPRSAAAATGALRSHSSSLFPARGS